MKIQNSNSQSFGLGKLEIPNTEVGKRIERIRPQLMGMGDDLSLLHISAHEPHEYGFYFERPITPFKDDYEGEQKTSHLYIPVSKESLPSDDESMLNMIKDFMIKAQTRVIEDYQNASSSFVEGLRKFVKSNTME